MDDAQVEVGWLSTGIDHGSLKCSISRGQEGTSVIDEFIV